MNMMKAFTPLQRRIYAVIMIIVLAIGGIAIKYKLSDKQDTSDYISINDIPGVEFLIPRALANSATAVTEIGEKSGLSSERLYSYTNGEDFYMIFCMDSYVFAVKKGTNFQIKQNGIETAFAENSLNGIWFEQISGSASVIKRNYTKIDVVAQVSLTPKLYNDFQGKLATVTDENGIEYTYFAGCTNWKNNEETNEIINFSVASLETIEEQAYALAESTNTNYIDTETGEVYSEEQVAELEVPEEPDKPIEDVNTEKPSSSTTTPAASEESTEEKEDTLESSLSAQEDTQTQTMDIGTNQKEKIVVSGDIAVATDIYSMLEIQGTAAAYSVYQDGPYKGTAAPVCVVVTKTFNDAQTRTMVDEYVKSGQFWGGETFTTPEGCHLEAAQFNVMFTEDEGEQYTVDVRIRGLDGRNLVYDGVTYPQRTYNLPGSKERWNNWHMGNIVFYVVPNGCKEYALSLAGVKDGSNTYAAWFRIDENQ